MPDGRAACGRRADRGRRLLSRSATRRLSRPRFRPVAASANAVVIFAPQTREEQLRHLLNASRAELVGGPTDADAYVLHIAATDRTAALARLRARREVVDGRTDRRTDAVKIFCLPILADRCWSRPLLRG